jgi:hypothetical protein
MEVWDNDDYERPIESYPGYLGHFYDGTFSPGLELKPLDDFDFRKYSGIVDENGGVRRLSLVLNFGTVPILFNAYDDIGHTLDQLPTIKVYLDNGPPDAGPASGGIILFFTAAGFTEQAVEQSIIALVRLLEADLALLEERSQG